MTTQSQTRLLYGGRFGRGRFALTSLSCGTSSERHLVIDPSAGHVLAIAEDKASALQAAREAIALFEAVAANDPLFTSSTTQGALWSVEELASEDGAYARYRPVSRRRRQVYERSAGRCAYCHSSLSFVGDWHVDHALPRALGGSDDLVNLVAACARCNIEKRDRSAIEYAMQRNRVGP